MSSFFQTRFFIVGQDGRIMGVALIDAVWNIQPGDYKLKPITPENADDIKHADKSQVAHLYAEK